MRHPLCALVVGTSLLSGCLAAPVPEAEALPSAVLQSLTRENGVNLNGVNLNGVNLNGNDLSGFLVGVSYVPARKGGVAWEQVWLEGTTFKGYRDGTFSSGEDFLGAELVGQLGDGSTVPLRITGIHAAPEPNADLRLYDVEYLASDGAWYPACRDASGAPVGALPVEGVWDYRQGVAGGGAKKEDPGRFTFACQGGAIAKCVQWGYRPWVTHNGVSLAPYHQTCTRMVRADYCGTGESHTQNGRRINLYDRLGIQRDTANWLLEAEWDERGARCFSPLNRSHALLPCYDLRVDLFCGQDLLPLSRGLLRNETPTLGGLL
jgi:ADYC domain